MTSKKIRLKTVLKIVAAVILILITVSAGSAFYLTKVVLDRTHEMQQDTSVMSDDPEEVKKAVQILCGSEKWREYVRTECEKWEIKSFDNLALTADFVKNDSHNYAILCHGFTGNSNEMMGRGEHLYGMGYNVLLPDARAHGESEGRYRGMGYLERADIQDWIAKIMELDKDASIVLFGQSMGAATVIMTSGEELPDNVKAIVADCGYTSVWDEFSLQLKEQYHLPSFPIMDMASAMSKRLAGYSFKDASPLDAIKRNELPILLIHGTEDTFVPFEYMDKLYDAANQPKEKLAVEGAGHCMSVVKNSELYWDTVERFLEKWNK